MMLSLCEYLSIPHAYSHQISFSYENGFLSMVTLMNRLSMDSTNFICLKTWKARYSTQNILFMLRIILFVLNITHLHSTLIDHNLHIIMTDFLKLKILVSIILIRCFSIHIVSLVFFLNFVFIMNNAFKVIFESFFVWAFSFFKED